MQTSEEIKPVYIFVKSSVSRSYKTRLSLAVGITQLVLSIFLWVALSVLPVGHLYISPIFFFVSALLSIVGSVRPNYSIVISTLAFAVMSVLCSGFLVLYFGGSSFNKFRTTLDTLAFFAANIELVVSIASFSMCCQSLCCGHKGYTKETLRNHQEGQMEPMVDLTLPSSHAPNTAERLDSMPEDDYGFLVNAHCSGSASDRHQTKEMQATHLSVEMPPSPRNDLEDLPSYADAITNSQAAATYTF